MTMVFVRDCLGAELWSARQVMGIGRDTGPGTGTRDCERCGLRSDQETARGLITTIGPKVVLTNCSQALERLASNIGRDREVEMGGIGVGFGKGLVTGLKYQFPQA